MPKPKNMEFSHDHPDIPKFWMSFMEIDRDFSGGIGGIMKCGIPAMKAGLLRGMEEGGLSREEAQAVIESKYIKTRTSPSGPILGDLDYLSPATMDLMEKAGVVKRRWQDKVKRQAPDCEGKSTSR